MRLIKPSFEIIEQPSGIEGIYKMIELAGRTAYKSENKITKDSAKEFVDRMVKVNHGSPLEHGTVYLKIPDLKPEDKILSTLLKNPYTICHDVIETAEIKDGLASYLTHYITTNYRVLVENNLLDALKYRSEYTGFHHRRVCVKFTCERGVSHEFVRHRVFSFLQESSRYCNYSKSKFNNEVTFIEPCWDYHNPNTGGLSEYMMALAKAEKSYLDLIEAGWRPQEAREVLPNATKTELIMTGFMKDWEHFFKLRCDNAAHPQARELAIPLRKEFVKRNYIYEV